MKNLHTIHFAACSATRAEGEALWFQTFPAYGRYPVGGIIEKAAPDAEFIFDEASAKSVIDAFQAAKATRADWPGILVDHEHYSTFRDKPSDALAWATDIRQDEDGSIWTRWEFTPEGRTLWESKTLVNRSPAFACEKVGKDYRPVELVSIAMTNTPHFEQLSTLAAARAAEATQTNPKEIPMDKLKEALGLGKDASEEDIVSAVNQLKEKASAAEAKATEAEEKAKEEEAKCRKMECDIFVSENKDKIADEAACREVFMASPDAARKMIAACKAVEAPKQKVLAEARKTPAKKDGQTVATAREQMNALPFSKRKEFYLAHKEEIDNNQ